MGEKCDKGGFRVQVGGERNRIAWEIGGEKSRGLEGPTNHQELGVPVCYLGEKKTAGKTFSSGKKRERENWETNKYAFAWYGNCTIYGRQGGVKRSEKLQESNRVGLSKRNGRGIQRETGR